MTTLQFDLRGYQRSGVDALRASYRAGNRAPLYSLPTGGGKTMVFSYITQSAMNRGGRVLILVHRAELLRQASGTLARWGVPHGCISPAYPMTDHPVQVASVQTIIRRLHRVTPPDLIIIDEAHHAIAGTWRKLIEAFPSARLLGVTATPSRLDGRGLGAHCGGYFDDMITGPSINDLIEQGFLARPRVFATPRSIRNDLDELRTRGGDWEHEGLERVMTRRQIIGDAVEHYARICPGVPAIAFCVSIKHAMQVTEQFSAAGWRARRIDGTMHDHERQALVGALGSGDLDVMVSVDLVSEGFDVPVCGAAILLRPTQSESLYLQQVGRALRIHPGKTHAFILDHADNTSRHGLPQIDREWTLDGRGARTVSGPLTKQCPSCFAVLPLSTAVCPECEHAFEDAQAAARANGEGARSEPDQAAGELVELTPEQIEQQRRERGRQVAQARTREDLERIARERGYRRGWVDHMMRAREQRGAAR